LGLELGGRGQTGTGDDAGLGGLQGDMVKRVQKSPNGRYEAKVHSKRVPNAWNHWNSGGRPCGTIQSSGCVSWRGLDARLQITDCARVVDGGYFRGPRRDETRRAEWG
jgi:hypothetical protein